MVVRMSVTTCRYEILPDAIRRPSLAALLGEAPTLPSLAAVASVEDLLPPIASGLAEF